jgi:thioesterase domain-containing protein
MEKYPGATSSNQAARYAGSFPAAKTVVIATAGPRSEIVGTPVRVVETPYTSPPTAESLRGIWEQVFEKSPIGFSDNFYDLGGNADRADTICAEIARLHGCQLPGAAISHAPTLEQLTSLLQRDRLPKLSPFIQIKPGTTDPPIFIAHGLSGMVEFYKLAKHIHTSHAIYGIQARGLDGAEEPFDRLEDMADYYLAALAETHSEEPYLLMGYSFGGLVALEMAQRLLHHGKRVALLALIDTYPHPRFMPAPMRAWLFARRMRRHAATMSKMPASRALSYLGRGVQRKLHLAAPLVIDERPPMSLATTMPRVNHRAYRAYFNYHPRFYPGAIKFVTTEDKTFFPSDPKSVWKHLTDDFEAAMIPGNHLSIVSTEYRQLAEALTRFVEKADIKAMK